MVKVGIAGLGRIGKIHLANIQQRVSGMEVVAAAEPFLNDEMIAFAQNHGVTNISKDYKDLIKDANIDAIIICSSTDTHAIISLEAIAAGKHVFCEKPVDNSLTQIQKVMDAVEKTELKFQVGFNRRFDHNFLAIRKAVMDGTIGDPHVIKITSRDPEPPNPAYIKVSGGMFMDMTIHDFDMARYLANAEVEEIYVASAVLVDPAIGEQGDVDTAIITMKMNNGALAVIDNSRRAAYGYDQRAEAFGNKGMVKSENDTLSTVSFAGEKGVVGEKPLFFFLERYMDSFATEMQYFEESIRENKPVIVGAHDGLQSVLIAKAAKMSVEQNRAIKLSEVVFD